MSQSSRLQWEYHVVRFPADDADDGLASLNAAGDDGWEAVGVVPKDLNESWVMLKRVAISDQGPERPYGFTAR